MTENPRKICFVAKDIFPLLGEADDIPFGGSEVKLAYLIRELTNRQFPVALICKTPESFNLGDIGDYITIYPWKSAKRKRKVLSSFLFYGRLFILLRRTGSDCYISQNANILIFLTALYCRITKKTFIHWISHDFDTSRKNKKGMGRLDFVLYKIGTRIASVTIVQTKRQQQEMKRNYNRDAFLIRNGHVILENNVKQDGRKILWIGRLKKSKQPHIFLDLADKMPEYDFLIAGSVDFSDPSYADDLIRRISIMPNVTFLENVPHRAMAEVYKQGICLVNTSTAEGFSNTFLEAWNFSLPVLSLNHDPDGCISHYNMGSCTGSVADLQQQLEIMLKDEDNRLNMGRNGKRYIREFHDITITTNEFIQLINNVN